jgi:hypothetical protein
MQATLVSSLRVEIEMVMRGIKFDLDMHMYNYTTAWPNENGVVCLFMDRKLFRDRDHLHLCRVYGVYARYNCDTPVKSAFKITLYNMLVAKGYWLFDRPEVQQILPIMSSMRAIETFYNN